MPDKKKKREKWVKPRHNFIFHILKFVIWFFVKIAYGYKYEKFKIRKGEKYIILSNHQATLDPVFVAMSFNKMPYFVTSDMLLHIKYASWWLKFCFNIIPKSKGKSDFGTVKTMLQVLKENGSVGIFPEGNRTFSGEICDIPVAISKFVKSAKVPVVLYNLCGGYGVEPRWSNKKRKGKFFGKIKRVVSVEELQNMSIEEVQQMIISELNHQELPTEHIYKSKQKAEKIERVLYACPECGSISNLHSEGNLFKCDKCNSIWEYTEKLEIKKDGNIYKYKNVLEWYKYQLDLVRNTNYEVDNILFEDNNVVLEHSLESAKKELLDQGKVLLMPNKLIFVGKEETIFELDQLEGVAVAGKQQVIFRKDSILYTIENNKELRNDFNAVKYITTINYIQSQNKEEKHEFFGI